MSEDGTTLEFSFVFMIQQHLNDRIIAQFSNTCSLISVLSFNFQSTCIHLLYSMASIKLLLVDNRIPVFEKLHDTFSKPSVRYIGNEEREIRMII